MTKKEIGSKYEVILITDENGIIFQFLIEKEKVEEVTKQIKESVDDYYNNQHTTYIDFDGVYEYLDYVLENAVGIQVNEVSIQWTKKKLKYWYYYWKS